MFVHIIGPNLPDQTRGSFHVHRKDCADVWRSADYRSREFDHDRDNPIEVHSLADIVRWTYADQLAGDEMTIDDGRNDFYLFPCVDGLPE